MMNWEFLVAILIALLSISLSLFFLKAQPLVSGLLIVGVWLVLIGVVGLLERRDRHGNIK